MLSLVSHQFLCASRNLTDKRYLQCQAVGCKIQPKARQDFLLTESASHHLKKNHAEKNLEGFPSFAASAEKILHVSHHFPHSGEVSGQILQDVEF